MHGQIYVDVVIVAASKIKTWHIEMFIVAIILFGVVAISKNSYVEILGTLAVLASFGHTQISFRLQELEEQKPVPSVECHRYLTFYFFTKEFFWFSYFIATKSYSALFGVVLFLLYPIWRKIWRKANVNKV